MSMFSEITRPLSPESFCSRLYAGEMLKFSGFAAMQALVTATRVFCEQGLAPKHPTQTYEQGRHGEHADCLNGLHRRYNVDAEIRRCWLQVFEAVGLKLEHTAGDRLFLRFQTHHPEEASRGTDVATAPLPFHRDTWGSNLYAQVNWWAPVYAVDGTATMVLYPDFWSRPVKNTTASFELPAVVRRNRETPRTRVNVNELIPSIEQAVQEKFARPVVIEPGELIAFSGAHLHRSIPNTSGRTRVSLETRTVAIPDVLAGRGAPNIDGHARWMAPGWFKRFSDRESLATLLNVAPICPYSPIR
jgi:hypothetical protein